MAENPKQSKELTTTQEGIIAGLVLLFFGLLYWYLNPWQSEKNNLTLSEKSTGTIQRNSLATTADNKLQPATTEANAQAATPPARLTAPQTQAASTSATAKTTATNATIKGTNAEPVLTTPATTTKAIETATANNATPNNLLPPPGPIHAATEPAAATTASTEANKPITIDTAAIPTANNATTEPAKPTTPVTDQSTTAQATTSNKLEFAPGSPEAQLQTYLAKGTLETPVGIEGISFEPKTAKITQASAAKVLLLAALLAQYPDANLLITTYTDETSTDNKDSDELSLRRANALGMQLVNAGVNGKRITIMGMGKKPSPDKTSATSKKSQQIEISVIQ